MNQKNLMYQEMKGAYIEACDSYSTDITGLYKTLNQIYRNYRTAGAARGGEEFIFETSMGIALRLKFFLRAAEVYSRNIDSTQKEELILTADQAVHGNLEVLRGIESTLRSLGLAIGPSFPDKFRDKLNHMKPGTVISFTDGNTYICENNDGNGTVTMTPIYSGKLTSLKIEDFQKQDSFTINTFSSGEVQQFYQKNHKQLSQTVESGYTFIEKSYAKIKQIESDVSKLHSKKVKIGSLTFVVRKAMIGDSIQWFAPDGTVVFQEKVAYLMSYLNTNPTQMKYKRKEPSYRKTAEDASFRLRMEHLLDDGYYAEVYSEMCHYSKVNYDDLIIRTDSFLRDKDGEYRAGTIIFRNGEAYQVSYEDNDFSKEEKVSHLSLETFKAFCEQKYSDTYERNYTSSLSDIFKKYHSQDEQILKNQAAIAKRMAESKTKQQTGTILSSEEFHQGASGYEDLIDNLDEDDPTVRNFLSR